MFQLLSQRIILALCPFISFCLSYLLMSFPWKPRKWVLHACLLFPVECGRLSSHPFNNHFWVPAFVPLAVPGYAAWSTTLMCRSSSLFLLSRNFSLMTWRHPGAMLRVQLRELREMGSWRREVPSWRPVTIFWESVRKLVRKCREDPRRMCA